MPKAFDRSPVKSCAETPRYPLLTSPYLSNCSVTSRAILTGIANPIPTLPEPPLDPIMAVFIPTSSPFRLTRAPPELPGFIDASVCIKFSYASIPNPDLPSALKS